MDAFTGLEIFATKGLEYLLVIVYLLLLIPAWWLLTTPRRRSGTTRLNPPAQNWFLLPKGFYSHPGHTWARPVTHGVMAVGMNEFAHKLIGPICSLELPAVGARMVAGKAGWKARVGELVFDILSPVNGVVSRVNSAAAQRPIMALRDPFGAGWLLEVAIADPVASCRSLLAGSEAAAWMNESVHRLIGSPCGDEHLVLQDGGEPVVGLAAAVGPRDWPQRAADLLKTEPPVRNP